MSVMDSCPSQPSLLLRRHHGIPGLQGKLPNTLRWFIVVFFIIKKTCNVTDGGLYDRVIGVWFPAGAKNFFPTGSGAHSTCHPVGTGGSIFGVNCPGHEADHSILSGVEVTIVWRYTSIHLQVLCGAVLN
jgi:hypothetical protein